MLIECPLPLWFSAGATIVISPSGARARVTRQSGQSGAERFEAQQSPRARRYYWSIWQEPTGGPEGTDVWAVEHGFVAVTPLRAGEFDAAAFEAWKDVR